jgi:hypothetical protein
VREREGGKERERERENNVGLKDMEKQWFDTRQDKYTIEV